MNNKETKNVNVWKIVALHIWRRYWLFRQKTNQIQCKYNRQVVVVSPSRNDIFVWVWKAHSVAHNKANYMAKRWTATCSKYFCVLADRTHLTHELGNLVLQLYRKISKQRPNAWIKEILMADFMRAGAVLLCVFSQIVLHLLWWSRAGTSHTEHLREIHCVLRE